jgi:hypothetical protein
LPWQIANTEISASATHSGGRAAIMMADPSATIESAMPISTLGRTKPSIAIMPPVTMISGNATGRLHTLRPPI